MTDSTWSDLSDRQREALKALADAGTWLRAWEAEATKPIMEALSRRGLVRVTISGGDLRYIATTKGRRLAASAS